MKRCLCILGAMMLFFILPGCGGNKGAAEDTGMNWQDQYDLGIRYLSEGNYEEAIIAFTIAIEIDATRPLAYIGRADACIGSGETAETLASALADYEAAVKLDETNPDGWLGMVEVYIRQGRPDKAQEVLEQALSKLGDHSEIAAKLEEIHSGNLTDSSGQPRVMIGYDGSGNVQYWHAYTYDEQGREASVTSYAPDGTQTGFLECSYAANGAPLTDYSWDNAGLLHKTEYVLDAQGNPVKKIWYDATGAVTGYDLYTNDADGDLIREESYSADGSLMGYSIYAEANGIYRTENYDSSHRLMGYFEETKIGTYEYNADGSLHGYILYLYDEVGNRAGYESYDASGTLVSRQTFR